MWSIDRCEAVWRQPTRRRDWRCSHWESVDTRKTRNLETNLARKCRRRSRSWTYGGGGVHEVVPRNRGWPTCILKRIVIYADILSVCLSACNLEARFIALQPRLAYRVGRLGATTSRIPGPTPRRAVAGTRSRSRPKHPLASLAADVQFKVTILADDWLGTSMPEAAGSF